jgi:hypothetical protein
MHGSKDTVRMPDVSSRRSFFRLEIVCRDQPLEPNLGSAPYSSCSKMHAARGPFFGMRFGRIFSLAFLSSSSVVTFRGPNSDSGNGVCFVASRQAREIIEPEALHSHPDFPNTRRDASSEGERCMKHTVHPSVHFSVHRRIFGRVRTRRSCAWHNDQIGRGQNTGLGWSDPTFVHVSVPKVIRGVAPAQLRGNRAECFVRAAFHGKGPQVMNSGDENHTDLLTAHETRLLNVRVSCVRGHAFRRE